MSVITISRGSYSKGKEVAEMVAEKLGYECVSRDVLLDASEEFDIPEIKLVRAIHNAPSILERLTSGKERYIAYIKAAILDRLHKDNVVYHGLAGHFFVRGISHVLKVRIIADLEERVNLEMEREGIGREEARAFILKDDEERRKWSQHLYGIDTWDSNLYDLVIHISNITVNDAVDTICRTAGLKNFQTTPESQRALEDLLLEARVKAALTEVKIDIQVTARDGVVFLQTDGSRLHQNSLTKDIERIVKKTPGIKEIRTKIIPSSHFGE